MKLSGPQRYANELRITKKGQTIMDFIGLSVSCNVIKHQIQIFGGHPTNIFTVHNIKRYKKNGEEIEEAWNIKLALSFVI